MKTGDRIKKIRTAANLTQQQFADALHTSRIYITQLEKGARAGSTAFIFRLRTRFQVNPEWWETGEGPLLLGQGNHPQLETKDKIILTRKILRMSQQQFARAVGYSQTYVSLVERGKVAASATFLRNVAQKSGIEVTCWEPMES